MHIFAQSLFFDFISIPFVQIFSPWRGSESEEFVKDIRQSSQASVDQFPSTLMPLAIQNQKEQWSLNDLTAPSSSRRLVGPILSEI